MIERPGHVLVAHHGCDRAVRDALLAGTTQLTKSKNPYDWLGDGAYVFEDDWQRAVFFAQQSMENPGKKYTKKPIHDHAVVGLVLRIRLWLDMCTREGLAEYAEAYADLEMQGTRLPRNKAATEDDVDLILRPLDRKVINHIHARRKSSGLPPYDAVRSHFVQGPKLLETSGFHRDTHVQIALRNLECVVGYFRVPQAEESVLPR